jgi:hypothetical protein
MAMMFVAATLAASFDAAAANAYRVEATLAHGGERFAAPTAVVEAGTPATVAVDGAEGYKLSFRVEELAEGKLKVSAVLASAHGDMSPVFVLVPGRPATVTVGDLAMSLTVEPDPRKISF